MTTNEAPDTAEVSQIRITTVIKMTAVRGRVRRLGAITSGFNIPYG